MALINRLLFIFLTKNTLAASVGFASMCNSCPYFQLALESLLKKLRILRNPYMKTIQLAFANIKRLREILPLCIFVLKNKHWNVQYNYYFAK
ncbi:hypothetical protein C9J12_25595 [Photobacterium frigidiphilum]|uniref:Secreted protein n=1 Tax=Photobacterium frigidiphilum TaxID=264736 RepID=A0A2T3J7P2_9GAMM|nr:hypothetical protein C9J12_25595 [Photobacterium frigidiphilum]